MNNMYDLVTTQDMLESNVDALFPDVSKVGDYFLRQVELEKHASIEGKRKHLEKLKNSKVTNTKAGNTALTILEGKYTETIEHWLKAPRANGSRYETALPLLIEQHPQVLAHIALKTLLNCILTTPRFNSTSRAIGNAIKEHVEWMSFHKNHNHLANFILKKVDEQSLSTSARLQMIKRAKQDRIVPVAWTSEEKLHIGAKLVDLLLATAPVISPITRHEGRKKQKILVPSAEFLKLLQSKEAIALQAASVKLPMVCEPLAWAENENGGYLATDISLIKRIFDCHWDKYNEHDLSRVYRAINRVQSTGWKVNNTIRQTMQEAWDRELTIGNLPSQFDEPRPAKPVDIDTNKEARNAYRRENIRVTKYNEALGSKRMSITTQLGIASKFKEYEAIYFPHSLDFRGRIYPIPVGLNPQEDDFGVGMLEFSEGKPLGDNGLYWLMVHLANLYDEADGRKLGQLSFDDRVAWVDAHISDITDSVISPLEHTWWATADKPWQCLAACAEYVSAIMSGNSEDFISYLPIQKDGSCNGLQHFTAILRDDVGGRNVNLTPSERPRDIYGKVADKCAELIRLDGDNESAQYWKGRVSRRTVKRPVMTLPYGVTKYGMVDQIKEKLKETEPANFDANEPAKYLVDIIYRALGETISSAQIGMDWLKESCQMTLDAGEIPFWVTPSGFPVAQEYFQTTSRRIKVYMGGRRTEITNYNADTSSLNIKKSKDSIAPNFIHSMDAAHLVLAVNRAVEYGVTSFSMVHDSYGCHAGDIDALDLAIRETFAEMYGEHDVLMEFAVGNIVPEVPVKGDLNINEVLNSEYFFA